MIWWFNLIWCCINNSYSCISIRTPNIFPCISGSYFSALRKIIHYKISKSWFSSFTLIYHIVPNVEEFSGVTIIKKLFQYCNAPTKQLLVFIYWCIVYDFTLRWYKSSTSFIDNHIKYASYHIQFIHQSDTFPCSSVWVRSLRMTSSTSLETPNIVRWGNDHLFGMGEPRGSDVVPDK